MKIQIKRLENSDRELPLPKYATEGSAGMDVYASNEEKINIDPGKTAMVPTGVAIALPIGFECQVRSRSGLAAKKGIFALNAPGTIDSDYRGEIKVILSNFGEETFTIKKGDRIAQLVIAKYEHINWEECGKLPESGRGDGGFGSTGVSGS